MSSFILLEDGDSLLQENNGHLVIETQVGASLNAGGGSLSGSAEAYTADTLTFSFRRPLTVNAAQVPASQSNFTALFQITDTAFRSVVHGGQIQNPLESGRPADFAIYEDEDLTTLLKFRITRWNSETGEIVGWVKIPSLTTSTTIYVAYGDETTFSYQGDDENIYDASIVAHWEMGDGSTLDVSDSAGSADGTAINSPVATTGKIEGAVDLESSSSQYIDLPDFGQPSEFTWSCWVNAESLPSAYNPTIFRHTGPGTLYTGIYVRSDGKLGIFARTSFIGGNAGYDGTGSHTLSTGTWYRLSITGSDVASPTRARGYVNGVLDGAGSSVFDFEGASAPTEIGRDPANTSLLWDGLIDDVLMVSAERTAEWLLTEYYNQNDPETFWSLGGEEGVNALVASVAEEGELLDEAFYDFSDVTSISPVEYGELSDLAFIELAGSISLSPIEYGELSDSVEAELVEYILADVGEFIEADDTTGLFADAASPVAPGMLVLTHIYFDEGREGFAAVRVDAPSHSHESRVLSFGVAEREIPIPVGPPRIGNIRLQFADTDQYFRKKFGGKTPRMRKIDLLIGPQGGSESMFQKPASAVIDTVTFPPGAMEIDAFDVRFNWLRNPIAGGINEEIFHNLPQASRDAFFPIVFGIVSSEGRGDQGAIRCIHVDTVDHRYAANRATSEEITVYVKEPDEELFTIRTTGFTIVEEEITIAGLVHSSATFIKFNSALPDGSEVRADIKGINYRGAWGLLAEEPGLAVLENPVDALINFLYMVEQQEHAAIQYDFQSFSDVREACDELEYKIAWAITEQITPEAALTQVLSSFNIDMFPSQQDKIKLVLSAIVPTDRPVFTDTLHLERESEIIQLAGPTKNRFRYKFGLLPAEGRFALESVYDNVVDQEALQSPYHDGIELEDVELHAVADPDVALSVILERSTWVDQQAHRMRVRIGAPPNLSKIDLAQIVGITHYGGLQEGGWVNEPFKIIRVALDFQNLEYELDLIKRVAPPAPPVPQPIDIGVWKLNSRVGPWYVASTRRLYVVMADTRVDHTQMVIQATPRTGTTIEVVDDGVFPVLDNRIDSFDCKRFEDKIYVVTQERTTGRVAFHIVDLLTGTWELLNEEILASNSHGDCGVTIAIREDGTVVVVFYGDREAGGPAFWLSMQIAAAGDYQRAYVAHRTGVGSWSAPLMVGEPNSMFSVFPIGGIDYNGAIHIHVGRVECFPTSGRILIVYNVGEPADVANTADMWCQIYLGDNTLSNSHEFHVTMALNDNTTFLAGDSTQFTYDGIEYVAMPIGRLNTPYLAIWADADTASGPTYQINLTNVNVHPDTFGSQQPDINVRWLNDRLHVIFGSFANAFSDSWAVHKIIEPPFTSITPSASGFPQADQIGPVWPGNSLARTGSEVVEIAGQEYVFKITSGTFGIPNTDAYSILESWAVEELPTASDYTLADFLEDFGE